MRRRVSLAELRDRVVRQIVAEELARYLSGSRSRPCATCARGFQPRTRWHFFCRAECRHEFYRGQFRPRARRLRVRRRRAA